MSNDYSAPNILLFTLQRTAPDQTLLVKSIGSWLNQAIEIGGVPSELIALRLCVDVAFVESLANCSTDLSSFSLAQLVSVAEIIRIDPLVFVLANPNAGP